MSKHIQLTSGRKIVKDLLHLIKAQGLTDRAFAKEAELSTGLLYAWRRRLEDGKPMYPRYSTICAAASAVGLVVTLSKRNY